MLGILNPLINVLVHQYFSNFSNCFLLVTDSNPTVRIPSGRMVVHSEPHYIPQTLFHHFGCYNIIIGEVRNPVETLGIMEHQIRKHQESFHYRRYLIVTAQRDVANMFKNYNLRLFCEGLVANLEPGSSVVSLWTFPSTDQKSVLIDRWFPGNNTFLCGGIPPIYSNLQKYSIKVGTFNYGPYVLVGKHRKSWLQKSFWKSLFPENQTISGLDIEILKTVAHHLNTTLEISLVNDFWGDVFQNGSAFGLKGLLWEGAVDLGAAGFFLSGSTFELFDLSTVYMRTELTCLVPEPRLLAPWLSPCYGFSFKTWTVLLITYTMFTGALFLISWADLGQRPRLEVNMLTVLKLVMQQPIPRRDMEKYFTSKTILIPAILATMVINIAYTGGYSSVMTKPVYENAINTLEDFLNSDLPWGSFEIAEWIKIWRTEGAGRYRKAGDRYVLTKRENLHEKSKDGNFGFLLERVFGQHYIESYVKQDVIHKYRVMKEGIHSELIVFAVRRNFVLLPKINQIIGKLSQSGIIDFWSRRIGHSIHVMQHNVKLNRHQSPVVLKIDHLLGAFYILMLGSSLAVMAFLIELLFTRNC